MLLFRSRYVLFSKSGPTVPKHYVVDTAVMANIMRHSPRKTHATHKQTVPRSSHETIHHRIRTHFCAGLYERIGTPDNRRELNMYNIGRAVWGGGTLGAYPDCFRIRTSTPILLCS